MKRIVFLLIVAASMAVVFGGTSDSSRQAAQEDAAAIAQGRLPTGYRDWRMISLSHEEGDLHSMGAILGNNVAIDAYRGGKLPFPDGTIIAALHYRHVGSEENNKVFGRSQSFVAGTPTNVQFMVKDSAKYASTGGWRFAHFNDGKAVTEPAMLQSCFECHARNKDRDLVFSRYAP